MLGSGPICWSSKKQATISLFSTEAGNRGAMNVVVQESWLHGILTEIGIHTYPSMDLYCGNQITIKISSDPVQK